MAQALEKLSLTLISTRLQRLYIADNFPISDVVEKDMGKNLYSTDSLEPAVENVRRKAADLILWIWAGVDPAKPAAAPTSAHRQTGVLNRLPDLRKFGPSIR
jgi:hypothetical protein